MLELVTGLFFLHVLVYPPRVLTLLEGHGYSLNRLPVHWSTHTQFSHIHTYGDISQPNLWEETGWKGFLWDEIVSTANTNIKAQLAPVHTERH